MDDTFRQEILSLIGLKQEGYYWDYKREWYNSKGDDKDMAKTAMLFDIICLANNPEWRDAYIIIGVDEENDCEICNIRDDSNRLKTQDMVCFLRDKPFAEDRPTAEVREVKISEEEYVDVIIVYASKRTPFYLNKDVRNIKAYHVYSRKQDVNTDRDKQADPSVVEKLWQNRFGLNAPALQRAQYFLRDPSSWVREESVECSFYHSVFPEFRLRYTKLDDVNGYEYYLFSQTNSSPSWWRIELLYHQTILDSYQGILLDSGRHFTPCPEKEFIHVKWPSSLGFSCFTKGTMRYTLHEFFLQKDLTYNEREVAICERDFMNCVLLFEDGQEKQSFLKFAEANYHRYAKLEVRIPYISAEQDAECVYSSYSDDYRVALIAQIMLIEFREQQQTSQ